MRHSASLDAIDAIVVVERAERREPMERKGSEENGTVLALVVGFCLCA